MPRLGGRQRGLADINARAFLVHQPRPGFGHPVHRISLRHRRWRHRAVLPPVGRALPTQVDIILRE